jgi:hypothetical protein
MTTDDDRATPDGPLKNGSQAANQMFSAFPEMMLTVRPAS